MKRSMRIGCLAAGIALAAGCLQSPHRADPSDAAADGSSGGLDRTVLPIAEPAPAAITEMDAR